MLFKLTRKAARLNLSVSHLGNYESFLGKIHIR